MDRVLGGDNSPPPLLVHAAAYRCTQGGEFSSFLERCLDAKGHLAITCCMYRALLGRQRALRDYFLYHIQQTALILEEELLLPRDI